MFSSIGCILLTNKFCNYLLCCAVRCRSCSNANGSSCALSKRSYSWQQLQSARDIHFGPQTTHACDDILHATVLFSFLMRSRKKLNERIALQGLYPLGFFLVDLLNLSLFHMENLSLVEYEYFINRISFLMFQCTRFVVWWTRSNSDCLLFYIMSKFFVVFPQ